MISWQCFEPPNCVAGTYSPDGKDGAGDKACIGSQCAAGQYGPVGATSSSAATCHDCEAGKFLLTSDVECKDTASSAPSCEVVFSSLPTSMDAMLTIAVEGSDFYYSSEYVSAVELNGQSIGGRYLEQGGTSYACGALYKILDHAAVPSGSISQAGELRVRLRAAQRQLGDVVIGAIRDQDKWATKRLLEPLWAGGTSSISYRIVSYRIVPYRAIPLGYVYETASPFIRQAGSAVKLLCFDIEHPGALDALHR